MSFASVAEHHYRAAKKAKERLWSEKGIIAVLMAGSVARGIVRPDSDVDLIAVVDDATWPEYLAQNHLAFLWRDLTDYPGGYVEGRYVPRAYVLEAAKRGSEPTRHSFTSVYPLYSSDPSVDEALPLIPIYPEHERQHRVDAFMAQLKLNKWFFRKASGGMICTCKFGLRLTWCFLEVVLFSRIIEFYFPVKSGSWNTSYRLRNVRHSFKNWPPNF